MRILRNLTLICLCAGLSQCAYGPTREAKVASAIQTLMASLIEGSFSGTAGAIDCGESGTFTAADPAFGNIDPLDPAGTIVTTAIIFSQCTIKVCGENFVLDGGGTSVVLNFADFSGISDGSTNSASIEIDVANQVFGAGFLTGTLSFSYLMSATVGEQTLQSITVQDTSPANPLSYKGKTFNGSELNDLADGC